MRGTGMVRRGWPAVLLALGLVSLGAPVDAACPIHVWDDWHFERHDVGMPATTDPSRTLESAELTVIRDSEDGDRLRGWVVLAAVPTAESDADLVVALGQLDEAGSCRSVSTTVAATHSPSDGVVREGATLTLDLAVEALERSPDCTWVSVTDSGDAGVVHDRMPGSLYGGGHADPPPPLMMSTRAVREVPVRKWVALRLRLGTACDLVSVRLVGEGRGVRARSVKVGIDGDGRHRVRMPVRLDRLRARYLKVSAVGIDADGNRIGFDRLRVKLRPRR